MATIRQLKVKRTDGTFEYVYLGANAAYVVIEIQNDDGTISYSDLQTEMNEIKNGLVRWNEGLEETS
jgi:hypothetical protein